MKGQAGFWDFEHSLEALSAAGDPLEQLEQTVRFEQFRPALTKAVRRSDPSKGGRSGFDVVLKFKMLVLQGLYGLSLQQTFFQVRDRLTWLQFCAPEMRCPTPTPCGTSAKR
jgi:IS5 family transposase